MAPADGSDDPSEGKRVLLLRDPLTGQKLRCRQEVMAWRELHEDVAADAAHDKNVAIGVGVSTGVFFGTLAGLDPAGALLLAEGMLTAGYLFDEFASDNAEELLARGIALYKRQRYPRARAAIELALAKDGGVGVTDRAYLFLGLTYAELGNVERARLALTMFLDRSGVRDVKAYRNAESRLADLGLERVPCESQSPVKLLWGDHPDPLEPPVLPEDRPLGEASNRPLPARPAAPAEAL